MADTLGVRGREDELRLLGLYHEDYCLEIDDNTLGRTPRDSKQTCNAIREILLGGYSALSSLCAWAQTPQKYLFWAKEIENRKSGLPHSEKALTQLRIWYVYYSGR
jgi:hypothetical protein